MHTTVQMLLFKKTKKTLRLGEEEGGELAGCGCVFCGAFLSTLIFNAFASLLLPVVINMLAC